MGREIYFMKESEIYFMKVRSKEYGCRNYGCRNYIWIESENLNKTQGIQKLRSRNLNETNGPAKEILNSSSRDPGIQKFIYSSRNNPEI